MPDLRPFAVSALAGLGMAAFMVLWWHWPAAIGGGVGLVVGSLTLLGTVSIGRDASLDDAAWRAAAPDLVEVPSNPRSIDIEPASESSDLG